MEKFENPGNRGARIWAIVATVLCLLLAGTSGWLWVKNNRLKADASVQAEAFGALEQQKLRLDQQLDSLTLAYADLRTENDSLQGAVAKVEHLVAQKSVLIRELRQRNTKDVKELRAQVAALQQAKTELETVISILKSENEQLKAENARLTEENEQLKGEKNDLTEMVGDLGKKLEEQIRKTQSARFKATSFRVEVEKRGDKLTTKAKKVREINISFDLADVPENFQGAQKVYLVISDEKGAPLPSKNPAKVTVDAPAGPIPIVAQQTRSVNLGDTQRLSFTYKVDDKIKKGTYLAAVYCDKGLLGVSSFKLL